MTGLAASIVRLWVRLYTAGLDAAVRQRIRQEVEADLWEQINGKDASINSIVEAAIIILRWTLGIPADVHRIFEESSSRGTARNKNLGSAVVKKKPWLIMLIVWIFCISMIFLGIGAFIIAGVLIIALKPSRVHQILNSM